MEGNKKASRRFLISKLHHHQQIYYNIHMRVWGAIKGNLNKSINYFPISLEGRTVNQGKG